MAKQFFKDLPNTTTPLNASRLNGLLDGEEALGNIIAEHIRSKNMFDKNNVVINAYLADNDGVNGSGTAADYFYSDYIEIEPNTDYYISGRTASTAYCIYDSNKTFLSRLSTSSPSGIINVSNSSAKYIRINGLKADLNNIQVEKGSSATTYSTYQELNYGINNIVKTRYINLPTPAGTIIDTRIPTNKSSGITGIVIFMKGSNISLVPFGRRWWTSVSSYSAFITTNSTLVGENTSTWTLTLTTTSTDGERALILYTTSSYFN